MTATDPARPVSILFWNEPHPFRNSYTEHLHISRTLLPVLNAAVKSGDALLRLFSNNDVIDKLIQEQPETMSLLQRPTNAEAHAIAAQFGRWDDAAIARWLDLVRGKGAVTEVYTAILERLHAEQPIEVIFTWSENGAVRRFARAHGIAVLHGELGPTRAPFPQTMYFDPEGTNGNAAFRKAARKLIEKSAGRQDAFLPAATWLVSNERANPRQEISPSLVDIGATHTPQRATHLPDGPYLYVPLQLADDLNTLLHSDFTAPIDFLRHVAELAAGAGYALVVKGHPGVKERPYNMRREIEALDWLERNVPEATILSRDCGPELSAYMMANAAYTVSINSSVSFESMILGVPPLVLGQAAFDADGWLQKHIPLLPADRRRDFGPQIDALVSTHMEHVLVPRDVVLETDHLFARLAGLARGTPRPITAFSHSDWHVTERMTRETAPRAAHRQPALGNWQIAAKDRVRRAPGMIGFLNPEGTRELTVPLGNGFTGYIDSIEPEEDDRHRIIAWALDEKTLRPPLMVLLIEGDTVTSRHRVTQPREDVAAAFPDMAGTPTCGFRFSFAMKTLKQGSLVLLSHDGTGQIVPRLAPRVAIGTRPGLNDADDGATPPR